MTKKYFNFSKKATLCCCGCKNDVSESNHYCSITGKRCLIFCYSDGAPERFGSRYPCKSCIHHETNAVTENKEDYIDEIYRNAEVFNDDFVKKNDDNENLVNETFIDSDASEVFK